MEPFERDELTDAELDSALASWSAPEAPAALRAAVFGKRVEWWRRIWGASIRIPLPVAVALALLAAIAMWRFERPPVRSLATPAAYEDVHELRPVAVLRPRIIRSSDANN